MFFAAKYVIGLFTPYRYAMQQRLVVTIFILYRYYKNLFPKLSCKEIFLTKCIWWELRYHFTFEYNRNGQIRTIIIKLKEKINSTKYFFGGNH